MTKFELIRYIRNTAGEALTLDQIDAVLRALPGAAAHSLRRDGEFALHGLGKLKLVERAARVGRNPRTGEVIEIPAKKAVKFVPAKPLEEALR